MNKRIAISKEHKKNTSCRYCQSTKLTKFLTLGNHPPSNSFIRPEQLEEEIAYPLEVYVCKLCFLVQLLDVVDAKIIFDEYVYLSSSSKALVKHYAELAATLTKRFNTQKGDVVVDIGSNDGILLNGYTQPDLVRIGVEPSKVAEIARQSGLEVLQEFFGKESAEKIVKEYGKAKVVTATNVFAHVDDIGAFVEGIPQLLHNEGVFIIEAAYLVDLIDQTLFDTIYHEHLCYLSLTPMVPFLKKYELEVIDAERIPFGASGPAIRVFVAKKGAYPIEDTVARLLQQEEAWGVKDLNRYENYAEAVAEIKKKCLTLIKTLRSRGMRIGGYGAPAKGNTLLNYFSLNTDSIEVIAETNTLKQGMLTPGSHIPIISEEEFIKRMPDYALLLTWNYLDFFLQNSEYIKKGGKFIVPLPTPHISPAE